MDFPVKRNNLDFESVKLIFNMPNDVMVGIEVFVQ